MKKLIFFLSIFSSLLITSCNDETTNNDPIKNPIKLTYGTIYNENENANYVDLNYTELKNKTLSKETFLLVTYNDLGCTCYTIFSDYILQYAKEFNLTIYQIKDTTLKSHDTTFNIETDTDFPSLCFFKFGSLMYQHSYYSSSTKNEFNDKEKLYEYLNNRIYKPDIYNISLEILDEKIQNNEEMLLYFGKDSCPDCQNFSNNVLTKHVNNNKYNLNVYHIETSEFDQNNKDKYGLSNTINTTLGYGIGYVPTLQYRIGNDIKDMDVYLNDSYENIPYYNENTLELHSFLKNNTNYIIDSTKLENEGYLLSIHNEISTLFLDTYTN